MSDDRQSSGPAVVPMGRRFGCHNLISTVYPLICVIAVRSRRRCLLAVSRKGAEEGVLMPMCQSPRIAEVWLHTPEIPANDNRAPAKGHIKAAPASLSRLVFCCAVALLLL